MAYLGDFVGQLLSEITMARVQADLEALRLAEYYARDPLLKHLPVPRFRLPNVTMRVPVAIAETPVQPEGSPPRGAVDPARISPTALTAMNETLGDLTLSREGRQKIERALTSYVERVSRNPELMPTATTLAEAVVEQIMVVLKDEHAGQGVDEAISQAGEAMRKRLTDDFVDIRQRPPRLSVLVTADELREAEKVVMLDFTLTEEAVEWAVVDTLSGPTKRLVIE